MCNCIGYLNLIKLIKIIYIPCAASTTFLPLGDSSVTVKLKVAFGDVNSCNANLISHNETLWGTLN